MTKRLFEVAILRTVRDLTRAFVTVEAEDEAAAEALALDMDHSEREFKFWQCMDCDEDDTAEATAIESRGAAECQNCDWSGAVELCGDIQDLHERVEPGETMPEGECPECGALCHMTTTTTEGTQQ